jgi:hypothetical protein
MGFALHCLPPQHSREENVKKGYILSRTLSLITEKYVFCILSGVQTMLVKISYGLVL